MTDRFLSYNRHPNLVKLIAGGAFVDVVLGLGALAAAPDTYRPTNGNVTVECKSMDINTVLGTSIQYEEGQLTATILDGNLSEAQVKGFVAESFLIGSCDGSLRQSMQLSISPATIECDNLSSPASGRSFNFDCSGLVTIDMKPVTPLQDT